MEFELSSLSVVLSDAQLSQNQASSGSTGMLLYKNVLFYALIQVIKLLQSPMRYTTVDTLCCVPHDQYMDTDM